MTRTAWCHAWSAVGKTLAAIVGPPMHDRYGFYNAPLSIETRAQILTNMQNIQEEFGLTHVAALETQMHEYIDLQEDIARAATRRAERVRLLLTRLPPFTPDDL